MIILHYTGAPQGEARAAWLADPAGEALRWLTDERSQVSAHYLVGEDGRVVQMVAEARRAWHAGRAFWRGIEDVNSRSVGIEIVNLGHEAGLPPFPDAQVEAVIALCRDVMARHDIPPGRVLAHSDVSPGRKVDPGERFPWARLAASGVGLWARADEPAASRAFREGDEGQPVQALQALFAMFGYGLKVTGVFDAPTRAVVESFQRHWAPERVDGVADARTLATLRALLSMDAA